MRIDWTGNTKRLMECTVFAVTNDRKPMMEPIQTAAVTIVQ